VDVTAGEPFFNGPGDQAEYLWEFTDTDLGQAWSTPAISRVTDGGGSEWAVFFGSGPSAIDQDNKIAYLYGIVADDKSALWDDGGTATNKVAVTGSEFSTLYYDAKTADFTGGETVTGDTSGATGEILDVRQTDANTGSLVLKNLSGDFQDNELITSAGGSATADGAQVDGRVDDILSSPLTVDLDFNHFADRIYAGNLYGTEYRFDSIGKGETPSITKLLEFDPAITAVNVNPIRAQAEFAYRNASGGIWVYFGTGRYEQQTDKTNLNQQWFFGLKDDLASTDAYTFDSSTEELLLGADVQATLTAGTLTDVVSGADARIITGTNPNLNSWAIKLDASSAGLLGSERVIQQPLVVAGVVFFTTFIPDTDICAGNGETWVYAVDFESGQALDEPVFDLNGDGVVNDQDYAEDANGDLYVPAGIFVGEGQGSYPVLHKSTLFVTTTGEGLKGLAVNLPGIDVELNAWKEVY